MYDIHTYKMWLISTLNIEKNGKFNGFSTHFNNVKYLEHLGQAGVKIVKNGVQACSLFM